MTKVVVTGANGFLGGWLCERLVQEGLEIHALVRKSSDLSELKGISVKLVYGDILNAESLNQAFKGVDSVFHLAGLIAYKKSEREKMQLANVVGTQNVVNACKDQGVRRLLHLSSVVAVGAGYSPQEILIEGSAFNLHPLNLGYFETKLAAERLAFAAMKDSSLEVVAVNPSTIYGASDAKKSSRKTQVKVARGEFPFFTRGGVSIIDVEDAVAAIYSAWKIGKTGERYILSGDNLTIKQLFELIANAANSKPPKILMPTPLLKGLGFIGDSLQHLGIESSVSSENAWTATLYHWFNSEKARQHLGLKTRPASESIEASVKWMSDQGLLKK